MTCHNCRIEMVKASFYGKNKVQRFKCQQCGKRFAEPQDKPFGEDVRLSAEKVAMILHCLVEGNSVRGTARVNTEDFVSKIRWATAPGWFDVSTDAFQPYESAIDAGLYDRANHAQVVKLFSTHLSAISESYSPAKFISVAKDAISNTPDLDRAGTSHVERKNGTLRQWCKRLTRLTYAFSKSWANLRAALALHFWHYSFARVHSALRVTPAMAAGITDHVWQFSELLGA